MDYLEELELCSDAILAEIEVFHFVVRLEHFHQIVKTF
jgi:hypothetical protein